MMLSWLKQQYLMSPNSAPKMTLVCSEISIKRRWRRDMRILQSHNRVRIKKPSVRKVRKGKSYAFEKKLYFRNITSVGLNESAYKFHEYFLTVVFFEALLKSWNVYATCMAYAKLKMQ